MYRRFRFPQGLDRSFLDLLSILEPGSVATISSRDADNVEAGDVEAWNTRCLLQYGE